MATNQHTLKIVFLLFFVSFLFSGCKSSEKKEENPATQETKLVSVQEQPVSVTPQDPSYDTEYNILYREAKEIHKNYTTLAPRAEKFVNSYFPNSQIQKHQFMTVSVIASACNYLLGNDSNAKFYGSKAFEYKDDKSIAFPSEWEGTLWKQGIDNNTVKKLVAMKDFIRSCSNGGFDAFCKANEAFFGKGQFLDAMQEYQNAMQLGLEKENLRKECYLRLSACYYKASRKEDCEKLFWELLVLEPGLDLNVGDQETRENLNLLKEKFLGENK